MRRFEDKETVETNTTNIQKAIPKTEFQDCFQKWKERLKVRSFSDHMGNIRDQMQNIMDQMKKSMTLYWPSICMTLIIVPQIIVFSIDKFMYDTTDGTGPIAKALQYNSKKNDEIWRYVTYMFIHAGYMHLGVNLLAQITFGFPLEHLHKSWEVPIKYFPIVVSWKVPIIYLTGVILGPLATFLTCTLLLAGASGGACSLITAHIVSVIMNWKQRPLPILQLVFFALVTLVDLGDVLYKRFYLELQDIGFEAHIAGMLAGFLVGIIVLQNFECNHCDKESLDNDISDRVDNDAKSVTETPSHYTLDLNNNNLINETSI